ncbi:hypothetical protein HH214_17445 [Mucilaginibacter robiniae]|uniref:Uncharacterized protein n=1 Tax=Mucilaginibacter robiniae TaxID=2728022 RepID=A0A7L5E4J9_9SPHI|nr:hypothetical protein [Mucilaginibacter robiniae]QJD97528.1 hypothetical protein HH214_17445 [Mucilaginibacter robiniae]
MSAKFFYLFMVGGTIAFGLLVYKLFTAHTATKFGTLLDDLIAMLILYYLAYKVYHEKKDNEMM